MFYDHPIVDFRGILSNQFQFSKSQVMSSTRNGFYLRSFGLMAMLAAVGCTATPQPISIQKQVVERLPSPAELALTGEPTYGPRVVPLPPLGSFEERSLPIVRATYPRRNSGSSYFSGAACNT